MGLFFYNKIGSIRSIGDLPTTNIIEPVFIGIDHLVFNCGIINMWSIIQTGLIKNNIFKENDCAYIVFLL